MIEKIKEKLMDYVEYPADQITADTQIIKDLEMNSFDIVTMLGELEEEYSVKFEQEDLEQILTVGDLAKYLESKM